MLSIVVVNFKNPALLRLCLKSLIRAVSSRLDYEIIVVDSMSTIQTRNVVSEEFKGVRLLPYQGNIGYTFGVNEGIRNARGDFFLILNPDIVPLENSIEKMVEYLKSHPDVGLLGPRLLNFDGTVQDSCFRFYTVWTILYRRTFLGYLPWGRKHLRNFSLKDSNLLTATDANWLMGSALMAGRKAVEKVGLMDEKLFLYFSEVDWARRFWENGYKVVYYPEAEMYHYHQRGSKGRFAALDLFLKKEARWHLKDAFGYFKKYWSKPWPV
ncbi:MAG: hypothetical protein A3B99_00250 [Candidatus Yanofskybacteria bacterium RIFCSPHIGHO2_02_FULL_44_12b]|uniref:Glycosyltransferase 2-like domain-containing protein n=1 Tax=Candidatus Yanofskybacteria bacterium RIFCSPLOWO2_01_FULL_44_22 TaxID=1802697 RepID=A0A1F8GMI1_9BACT|nr:MAG: hypothetical protein A2659_01695 [Candidatus Yanofskybacteria bacterium RIFCSPHIGHO2_01_FULL_44_24]OGN14776.1 MAG: hypothetical protein A3B99_00250 [Candidatus Yanofskybacteria bacterium RIFCSPHIGHO2_02_FULL_44_12b]OGN25908.1 MAG: hypothetical protein A2925_02615 [Candidatus Yanofskybacteria bacterium RIFCSPLOWO2_01_FULL_44_22]